MNNNVTIKTDNPDAVIEIVERLANMLGVQLKATRLASGVWIEEPWPRRRVYDFTDFEEANGRVWVEQGAYGLEIGVAGVGVSKENINYRLALVDLAYLRVPDEDDSAYPQLVIDDPREDIPDNVAFAKFKKGGTRIRFEYGVQELATGRPVGLEYQPEFGYPED